jgi:hypothetical protein
MKGAATNLLTVTAQNRRYAQALLLLLRVHLFVQTNRHRSAEPVKAHCWNHNVDNIPDWMDKTG